MFGSVVIWQALLIELSISIRDSAVFMLPPMDAGHNRVSVIERTALSGSIQLGFFFFFLFWEQCMWIGVPRGQARAGRLCVNIGRQRKRRKAKHSWRDPRLEAKSHHKRCIREENTEAGNGETGVENRTRCQVCRGWDQTVWEIEIWVCGLNQVMLYCFFNGKNKNYI